VVDENKNENSEREKTEERKKDRFLRQKKIIKYNFLVSVVFSVMGRDSWKNTYVVYTSIHSVTLDIDIPDFGHHASFRGKCFLRSDPQFPQHLQWHPLRVW
jgi:hypothetical protein